MKSSFYRKSKQIRLKTIDQQGVFEQQKLFLQGQWNPARSYEQITAMSKSKQKNESCIIELKLWNKLWIFEL